MSDELRLPDDLAACEAQLAGLPLPASGIDRDQLLFQAGWAAALAAGAGAGTARLALVDPLHSQGAARGGIAPRRTIALWSAVSAALAASLAAMVTLQLRPSDQELKPALAGGSPAIQVADAEAAGQSAFATDAQSFVASAPRSPARRNELTAKDLERIASLLAARRQSFGLAVSATSHTPGTAAVAGGADAYRPLAKTAKELMDEYLPGAAPSGVDAKAGGPRLGWPWNSSSLGETI